MKIDHSSKYRNENFPKSFTDAVRGGLCWEICPRIRKKVLVVSFLLSPVIVSGFSGYCVYGGLLAHIDAQVIF
jgi:hypothetical protein